MASPFRRPRATSTSSAISVDEDDPTAHVDNYLRVLKNPVNPNIDIVAVHGLNFQGKSNHGEKTWSKNDVLWLQDDRFLPGRFPSARVMLFSYNSRVMVGTSSASILDVATELLNRLKSKRRDDPSRPILFLCHSLGGIVLKQALVRAVHGTKYNSILRSTKSIAFFGTPHRGGRGADLGSIIASVVLVFSGSLKNNFMETLQKGSTSADTIHELFKEQALDYRIVSFFETLPYTARSGLIVEKVSATLGLPDSCEVIVSTAANHSDICKFDRLDDRYELVIENIADLVRHAIRRPSIGTPLLAPTISVVDPEDRRRTLSIGSSLSSPSLDYLDSAGSTSRESLHVGMPTFPDDEVDRSRVSTPDNTPNRPVIILPYSSNPDFIGRDKIFDDVKSSLKSTASGQGRIALYGLGGVGKSQLAVRYAYWYRHIFPDHSVFWVHCGTAERFRQGLIEIGVECRVPGISDRNQNRLLLLKEWLQRNSDFKWLLILDNADDQHIFRETNDGDDLSSYIPDCEQGSVLITTRDLVVGRRLANGRTPIQINKMSREEAVAMLRTRISTRGQVMPMSPATPASFQGPVHDSDLLELAQALDYLPLAMVQAAGFIMENSLSVRRYLNLFEDDASAVDLLQRGVQESGRISDIPNSVYATWKLSITQIQERYPKSAELIFLMAYYEQVQIPMSLLKHHIGHNTVELTATIGVLLRFSLIVSGRQSTYNMHRLVQLIVKQWLEAANVADEWQSRALRLLSDHFPSGEFETWVVCSSLESHAVKMIQTPGSKDSDKPFLGTLQQNLAWYLSTRGRWVSAEDYARAACITFQECYGLRNRKTLVAKIKFAYILKQNSKLDEAEVIVKQVIDESKALVGTKDEQYFDALDLFAVIAQTRGRLGAAEKAVRKSLAGREKILGQHHPSLSRSYRRLATILEFSGKYNDAEIAITKALQGQKHLIGTGDRTTLLILQRLAFIQRAQGKYDDSEKTARQYLEAQSEAYGPKHIDTQEARYSMAAALAANNKLDEAEAIFLSLVDFIKKEQPFDENHQYNFYIQNALGGINFTRGEYIAAMKYHEIAWIGIKNLYKDHMKTYEYQSAYAAAMIRSDAAAHLDQASKLQQEACSSLERLLGADHPSTLSAYIFLSEVYLYKKDFSQSAKVARKALRGREKMLNAGHPDIALAKKWLLEVESKEKSSPKIAAPSQPIPAAVKEKTERKRRSFLGFRKLVSSSNLSLDIAGHDISVDKNGFNVTNKLLEKVDTNESSSSERWDDSKSSLGLGLSNVDDSKDNAVKRLAVPDFDSESDDDDKERGLDYEKSAAYTTHPPPISTAVAATTRTDHEPASAQALSRKRSEAMARAIEEHDTRRRESKRHQRISGSQSWPREDQAKSNESQTTQIRRKPITPRTSTYPQARIQSEAVEGGELPAEVPINPAARLDGPGWDDQPFSA